MAKLRNKLGYRLVIAKSVGFVLGLIAFFVMPLVFGEMNIYLRVGMLLWITTLGGIIGLFGVMDKHPLFDIRFTFWFRGIFMGAWMNFMIVLFGYSSFMIMMQGSMLEGYSPFWFIIDGAIMGLIIDYIATKYAGEGKKLLK